MASSKCEAEFRPRKPKAVVLYPFKHHALTILPSADTAACITSGEPPAHLQVLSSAWASITRLKGTLFRSFQIRSRAVSRVAAVPHLAWQREFILLKAIAMAILHRRWRIHWEPHGVPTPAVASPPHWMMPLIVRLRPLGTTRIRAMKSWLSAPEMSRARRQRTKIEGRHGKIFVHGAAVADDQAKNFRCPRCGTIRKNCAAKSMWKLRDGAP